jgi:predicted lysophospholipase L1 biosynthesis ABC-type transport system permease subunit
MDLVATRVGAQFPEVREWGIRLLDFSGTIVPASLRTALLVLLGAVGFVLLIACANLANLLLARASSRQKEIAVRTALGASRNRLLAQFLTESLLLSAAGGVAGLLAALWSIQIMNRSLPPGLLPVPEVAVDSSVLAFALGVTLVTGLLFGLAPAWHAAGADLNAILKGRPLGHWGPAPHRAPRPGRRRTRARYRPAGRSGTPDAVAAPPPAGAGRLPPRRHSHLPACATRLEVSRPA